MMEDLWRLFCGESNCSRCNTEPCSPQLGFVTSLLCTNNVLIIVFHLILLVIFLINMICKSVSKRDNLPSHYRGFSTLQIWSAVINGGLGLVYIGLGTWILAEKIRNDDSVLPVHWWVLYLLQGFTWLLVGITASLWGMDFPESPFRILVIFAFLSVCASWFLSLFTAIVNHEITVKVALDILTFLGASLLLLCTYRGYKYRESGDSNSIRTLYNPLSGEANGSTEVNLSSQVIPFANAGLFNKISFWWLNPLMILGRRKTLEEDDIPKLRGIDRAESCYLQFLDKLNNQKQSEPTSESSILWRIVACNLREIIISGFFALLKVLTVSAGPLLLNAFIEVAEGKATFKYEGYLLAISLFLSKTLESLSQRQWNFRSKLVGLKVRSLLTAAIYKKQLRLSNAARMKHSGGEITNYVTVDAYRIGEFPFWFHQIWATSLQLCIVLVILINAVGLATIAVLVVIIFTVLGNTPLAKLEYMFQSKLMVAQDRRLKACYEALVNMKVLKLYAWETHFKNVIEELRKIEYKCLSVVQLVKTYSGFFLWTSPVLVSTATFGACHVLEVPFHANNVFTFIATLRLVQDPIRAIPDVIGVLIQAKVSFKRICQFLEAPELHIENVRKNRSGGLTHSVLLKSAYLSWDVTASKPTLRNINLKVQSGEKVAICGEVGSGKSTLLAAILGEVPHIEGTIESYGSFAYVSQTAWIQTGTIRDNILFGSAMDELRYHVTLQRCSLRKDLELLPYGDMTEIGERGVNLSGGQRQRIQLARALYRDADVYLLDDPFSAVDAHTATSLFNEYVMEALSAKTVLLVTHQVDFLPAFHCCLLMSDGELLQAGPYHELLISSTKFSDLVNAHKETAGTETPAKVSTSQRYNYTAQEIKDIDIAKQREALNDNQLIKQEEREVGDTGLKPYLVYLNQNKGYVLFTVAGVCNLAFLAGQISQNSWMATGVDNPHVSTAKLVMVYIIIGFCSAFFLLIRSLSVVALGLESSNSLFSQLLNSLFRAPMSFYDSTPLGRILSRVSADLTVVDLDVPFSFLLTLSYTMMAYSYLGVLAVITWQVLIVSIPVIYLTIHLQRYYFATAKELMRINGTTKSLIANHLGESLAGVVTIRAFKEEDRFFDKIFDLIDRNASPFFHSFASSDWLVQRLEILSAIVLSSAVLLMVLLPPGSFSSGFIGMALVYGLSLNLAMVFSVQHQCTLANYIISVERLDQYMHIPSEAPEVIEDRRPPQNWPSVGEVKIRDLQIRYRPDTPLVLEGITCTFEGRDKIGIVGRTGSGKTTLIGALFRLVEPAGGKIIVDGIDICSIGLHDLRSQFGIIPQDPTLFNGTVLGKCQFKEVVQEKEHGLNSLVMEDGSNWSMGQRQLFCLGRALLGRSRILVLDEATASIDNATDIMYLCRYMGGIVRVS